MSISVTRENFFVSNVGDSRCIVFRQNGIGGGSTATVGAGASSTTAGKISHIGHLDWVAESLSRDHKPNMAGESDRIISMNGRIDYYKDSNG